MVATMGTEVELKSTADKFWRALTDANALLPKVLPKQYKSIEIIEGDGKSVGSIRLLTYAEEMPIVKFAKEKLEIADEENKTIGYSVIDGELVGIYKVFKATYQVVPQDEGCAVKISFEYEKASEEVPEADTVMEVNEQTLKELDAYICA